MAGRASRSKGKRGEREARRLLESRGWNVIDGSDGQAVHDLTAIDPDGDVYGVEVKNCASLDLRRFRSQAREQAKRHHLHWLLLAHIPDTRCWYAEGWQQPPELWRIDD